MEPLPHGDVFRYFGIAGTLYLQFYFQELYSKLLNTRPTAVNLRWAIDKMMLVLSDVNTIDEAKAHSKLLAKSIMQDDIKRIPGLANLVWKLFWI